MTYEECVQAVGRPGKFEGERPYVPYFWEIYLDGLAERDHDGILTFHVLVEDREMFPELKRRRTVALRETDQGFVVEV